MSYSTEIKNALDGNAPLFVRFKSGITVNNKWIVESHKATPTLGDEMRNITRLTYTVFNYANIADQDQESYRFSEMDEPYYSSQKRSARIDAQKKADELNERDNIKTYVYVG